MTLAANWELKNNYIEVPVTVNFDGETKEYVKAYAVSDGKIKIGDNDNTNVAVLDSKKLIDSIEKVGKLKLDGYLIKDNATDKSNSPDAKGVYIAGKITYGDNKELPDSGKTIPATSTLSITYTFNSDKYSKVIISSIAFKDGKDVTLYADTASDYTYRAVFNTLIAAGYLSVDATDYDDNAISTSDNTVLTNDKHYVLSKWNGTEYLNSTRTAPATLTLDAKLNGYSIAFMSKGQFEVKFVEFGKLTADVCTLDVSGLDHWVMITPEALKAIGNNADVSSTFTQFNFSSQSSINMVETEGAKSTNAEKPVYVLVACYAPASKTAYAVFDAINSSIVGNFGNEFIDRIVIPGEVSKAADNKTAIPTPSVTPVYDEGNIFVGWGEQKSYTTTPDVATLISANVSTYKYTITFYDGSKVVGIFYLTPSITSIGSESALKSAVAAIQYDGKLYGAPTGTHTEGKYTAIDAYDDVLNYDKDGYILKLWNDSADKAMITIEKKTEDGTTTVSFKVNMSSIKSDISLYGQFDAKSYTINYVDTLDKGSISQDAIVDSPVNLYKDTIFNHANDGYTLKQWSTIADGSGTVYALGSSFTLSGADYEKLLEKSTDGKVVVTLYSVWEKTGGSDVPGGNTGGDSNDNTALYLIAGMLAVIAILAIVGIVLMRKK